MAPRGVPTLMQTGKVTYPRPNRDELIAIRRGEWSLDRVCQHVSKMMIDLDDAVTQSSLPEKCDRAAVTQALVTAYDRFYDL